MSIWEVHDAGIAAVQREQGSSCPVFVWKGKPVKIQPGSAVRGKDLGAGGFRLRSDLKFVVRVADLPVPRPALKQIITYLGNDYRVDTMEQLAGGLDERWECNDPNQGA